jgi:hypothetical protein
VRQRAVDLHDFPVWQLECRVLEPRAARPDHLVVGHGTDPDQDVGGQALPARDDRVVAEECPLADPDAGQGDRTVVNSGAAEVDAVGEEGARSNVDQFGNHVDDGADLTATPHFHAGPPQPHRLLEQRQRSLYFQYRLNTP